jgi:hypothetical protein
MTGTVYQLEVNPQIPERLERLEELANNLWYSWDSPTRRFSPAFRTRFGRPAITTPRPSSSAPTRKAWKPPPRTRFSWAA